MYIIYLDHTHLSLLLPSALRTPLFIYSFTLIHWIQLVLSVWTWAWGNPLGHGKLPMTKMAKEKWLFSPQELSTPNSSRARGGASGFATPPPCFHPGIFSQLDLVGLRWVPTTSVSSWVATAISYPKDSISQYSSPGTNFWNLFSFHHGFLGYKPHAATAFTHWAFSLALALCGRSQTLEMALCSWWTAHASLMTLVRQIFLLGPQWFLPSGARVLMVNRAHGLLPATREARVARRTATWHTAQKVAPKITEAL